MLEPLNVVVDLSHHNGNVDQSQAQTQADGTRPAGTKK